MGEEVAGEIQVKPAIKQESLCLMWRALAMNVESTSLKRISSGYSKFHSSIGSECDRYLLLKSAVFMYMTQRRGKIIRKRPEERQKLRDAQIGS